ncbi:hypothetical protein AVL48_15560 [Amycolatopsis regifaucium]|uniref:SnoaL-like domain-containing protein n=1 Tax=Amycolatopsis regifaucium TaxID=546365 RepID=A0A154M5A5_9PSEU|nr:hypothetical protein AVL48_15560 [Amycolatopsis regifaucium]OKA09884.1 hypothetical protein ATP06_0205850 [Amycolatopsis regifaucium]SFI71235.1 hypothetical protein SAMN04489731_112218 [Amycolatopsis regifaucium]
MWWKTKTAWPAIRRTVHDRHDVETLLPMGIQHTAEHFRLRDGRIEAIRLIFDATPWHPVLAAAGSA